MSKPGIKVTSAFGETHVDVTDGQIEISIGITKRGIRELIEHLEVCYDMADDPEVQTSG